MEKVLKHVVEEGKDYPRFMDVWTLNVSQRHFSHQFEYGLVGDSLELEFGTGLCTLNHLHGLGAENSAS